MSAQPTRIPAAGETQPRGGRRGRAGHGRTTAPASGSGPRGPLDARTVLAPIGRRSEELPSSAVAAPQALARQLARLDDEGAESERRILAWPRAGGTGRRRETVPGIGPITATAIAATGPDPGQVGSGQPFAACLGLTPRANSSGGKERQGGVSRAGDGTIRRLPVVGATAVLRLMRQRGGGGWISAPIARKKPKVAAVAAVAVASKTARLAWALMTRGEAVALRAASEIDAAATGRQRRGRENDETR